MWYRFHVVVSEQVQDQTSVVPSISAIFVTFGTCYLDWLHISFSSKLKSYFKPHTHMYCVHHQSCGHRIISSNSLLKNSWISIIQKNEIYLRVIIYSRFGKVRYAEKLNKQKMSSDSSQQNQQKTWMYGIECGKICCAHVRPFKKKSLYFSKVFKSYYTQYTNAHIYMRVGMVCACVYVYKMAFEILIHLWKTSNNNIGNCVRVVFTIKHIIWSTVFIIVIEPWCHAMLCYDCFVYTRRGTVWAIPNIPTTEYVQKSRNFFTNTYMSWIQLLCVFMTL